MNVARAKGHLKGKQPKLTVNQARHLVELDNLGTYSTAELAELFGVSRSTIYRTLQRVRPMPADRISHSPWIRSSLMRGAGRLARSSPGNTRPREHRDPSAPLRDRLANRPSAS